MTPTDNNNEQKPPQPESRSDIDPGLMRPGGISYLHIPATDVRAAAAFYGNSFDWHINNPDSDRPSFDDTIGHISGAWVTDQTVSREPGLLPYIYVDRIDETIARIAANGGEVVKGPDPEGNLWIARFRDPAGNVLGLWHAGPR
jgi:predicted enzyme related to lactoylglutathione lyase